MTFDSIGDFEKYVNKLDATREVLVNLVYNILTNPDVTEINSLKLAVAAHMLDVLELVDTKYDGELIEAIHSMIAEFSANIERETGITNVQEIISNMRLETKEKVDRIIDGEDILKNISLN